MLHEPIILKQVSRWLIERPARVVPISPVFAVKLAKMHRKEQKRRTTGRWAVIGMLCLLLLAACGQKGDLYLPDGEQSGSRQTG